LENRPTNLLHLFRHFEADDIGDIALPELPHHALLDARLLAPYLPTLGSTPTVAVSIEDRKDAEHDARAVLLSHLPALARLRGH
jgi:hypothetical protein